MAAPGRVMAGLGAGVLLLGLAESTAGPYLVLFASRAGLSPLRIGIVVSVISLSGMLVATRLARRFDARPARWPALLAVGAPAAGYLLLTVAPARFAVILVISALLLGVGPAAFPQLFTLAHAWLHPAGPRWAARAAPLLRSAWSTAWTAGPILGGVVLARWGFHGLFVATACGLLLVTLPVLLLGAVPTTPVPGPSPDDAEPDPEPDPPSGRLLPVLGALGLFHAAMFAGGVVLPLQVTQVLHRPDADVGLLFSVCAAVEIPAAFVMLGMPARVSPHGLLLLGTAVFVPYFVVTALTTDMSVLLAAQVARGTGIAVVGVLGIVECQRMLPGAPGRATALFANTAAAGSLASGVLAGGMAEFLGFRASLLACAVISVAACLLLVVAGVRRPAPVAAPMTR